MKHNLSLSFLIVLLTACSAVQSVPQVPQTVVATEETPPKLMVGIVVDQMRYDYLDKYWSTFGEGGFKRLVGAGFSCKNNHFSYASTLTGPGHAAVYTGTTPAHNGIVGNNWYDRDSLKVRYVAEDLDARGVGHDGYEGYMSPRNLEVTTITDELKIATRGRGKVVGISIKDRGAILPSGHAADGAYWYVGGEQGKFISSNWYMKSLPQWVQDFNAQNLPEQYLNGSWELSLPIEEYSASTEDNTPYESSFRGESIRPVLPYNLKELRTTNGNFHLLPATPYGNTVITALAKSAIAGEQMGQDNVSDFLCISYSSTDYVGHQFGAAAVELQDTYIKLDGEIAELLSHLDSAVGKGEYTVFLTADHAAAEVPSYLQDQKIPGGYFDKDSLEAFIDYKCVALYGDSLLEEIEEEYIYLNHKKIEAKKLDLYDVQRTLCQSLIKFPGIGYVFKGEDLRSRDYTSWPEIAIKNAYHQRLGGDIVYLKKSGWIRYSHTGTTHGSPYRYDTHAPLLWFGKGITHGQTFETTHIKDIAPTVAAILHVQEPSASTGQPISEVLEK